MAFSFEYKVTLVLTHPNMSADEITRALTGLSVTKAITSGEVREFKSGRKRAASVSVWESQLHDESLLDSEAVSLTAFLEKNLLKLDRSEYKELFSRICEGGHARLEIVWKSRSIHSAGIIEPSVLKLLGEFGLSLDLEVYDQNAKVSV